MPGPKDSLNRQHRAGVREPSWSLEKGPRRLACELVDNGARGAEYRLLIDGEVYAHRRFGRIDLAVVGTEDLRRQFEHNGWTGRSIDIVSLPDAGTRTAEDIDPDVEALIKRSKELQTEAEELLRTAEELATKAARLKEDLATRLGATKSSRVSEVNRIRDPGVSGGA